MNEIHEKLSVWSKLHKQWEMMEAGLRCMNAGPAERAGTDLCAMEVELKALRARVDTAFNDASAAVHNQSKMQGGGSTAGLIQKPIDKREGSGARAIA